MSAKRICVTAMAAAVLGCASAPKNSGAPATADEVKIYSPAQLRQGQYEIVQRLWVESWRAKFWVPSYSTQADGLSALRDKAAGLDANGLINVACYTDRGLFSFSSKPDFTCYGQAIRVQDTDK